MKHGTKSPKDAVKKIVADYLRGLAARGLNNREAREESGLTQKTLIEYKKAFGIEFVHGPTGWVAKRANAKRKAKKKRAGS